MIVPGKLGRGDRIAIVSPASSVKEEYVEGAERILRGMGFDPVVYPHALGPADGSFASTRENRLSDLRSALLDPTVKAILCARGGYGCVHLLEGISVDEIREHPKWLIGYSDISALHALWNMAGVVSLHAPMAKHLASEGEDNESTRVLLSLLTEDFGFSYKVAPNVFNRPGKASGRLVGGNLAVLNGLAGTPYDLLAENPPEGVILFIEDISEAIYAVERMLFRLKLAGTLARIRGLIVGQFTEYRPDRNYTGMEEMISRFVEDCGLRIPVSFGFPVGHVSHNLPMPEGALVDLEVCEAGTLLRTV